MDHTIKNLRALEVRFYGPTNRKGSRIRIRDLRELIQKPLWLEYDHSHRGSLEQAYDHLGYLGWNIESVAKTPEGYLLLASDFSQKTWRVQE